MRLAALLLAGLPLATFADAPAILKQYCGDCHSARARTSGFSIEQVLEPGARRGPAVVPGHPEQSPLVQLLKGELTPRMPMGRPLPAEDIATIETWIRQMPAARKAVTSEYRWPFEKPKKHASFTEIDQFLAAKWQDAGVTPAKPVDARTLVRRVYFDLIGLPPSPQEMAEYKDADYEKLIDKLLADPRYGERWGRHWLDLARYGETSGLEGDGQIGNAWRYRDWVIDAFNRNMPYDKFVIAQLAGGDEHSKTRNNYQPDPQGYVPTGFLRVAPWDRSNLVAADVRQNYLSEVTTVTSSVFLGLTTGCARCHNHKYDPIPQKDYYRLQAFFNTTQPGNVPDVPFRDKAFAEKAEAKVKELEERAKNGPEKKALERLEQELLPKLIAARAQRSEKTGGEFKRADLRLELRLKKQRIFTEAEKEQYLELKEAADRTGDTDEQAPLEALEDKWMPR
ncbi:MAG: DUF1549 domain-containing protein, partial [Acidobacteria bacterium]|nr:DUF1549 domain-containing protein [Acidobacteriota bacterium]